MQTGTWKAVFLLLLAAILGGAVGSFTTARLIDRDLPPRDRGGHSEWYVDLLTRELKLSRDQQDSVRAVLKRHRPQMDSLWATLDQPMAQMREAIRADIRTVLTDAQRTHYTEVTARLDAHRREMTKQDSTNR